MRASLRRVGSALPTLFAFHAARTLIAIAVASPILSLVGDSRWYAATTAPARLELGLLAQTLYGLSNTSLRLAPWLAALLLAYIAALPLASASCQRALLHPGRLGVHLAFAWHRRRAAYGVAFAALLTQLLWLAACASVAWALIGASTDVTAPVRDVGIMLLVLACTCGCLMMRTVHDVALATVCAGETSLRHALRQAMCVRLCAWTSAHLASWTAICALWGLAAVWGFALSGEPVAGATTTVGTHQIVALASACMRWWWLAAATSIASRMTSRHAPPLAESAPA